MKNRGYDIIIRYSPDDKCYIAYVPDLPGCMGDGITPSDAARAAEREIELWIDVNKERGINIPRPGRKSEMTFA